MKDYRKTKNDIVLAIEAFTRSIDSSNDYRGDMSLLVQVTSNLKLVRLGYWERLIRSELNNNLHATTRPIWARLFEPNAKLNWLDVLDYFLAQGKRAAKKPKKTPAAGLSETCWLV